MEEKINQPIKKERRNLKVRQLFNTVRSFALTEEEKSQTRMMLNALTLRYPVRDEKIHENTHERVPFFMRFIKTMPVMAGVGLAIILGGFVSLNADGALPGNMLYAVKVSVNEPIRGLFAASSGKRAEWNTELAMKRLSEAESLAKKGRLDSNARNYVDARISEYTSTVLSEVAKLQSQNNTEAAFALSARYEAGLHAHATILSSLINSADAAMVNQEIQSLADGLNKNMAIASAQDLANENALSNEALANLAKSAESNASSSLKNAALVVADRKTILGNTDFASADALISEAKQEYALGYTAEGAGDYKNALPHFRSAFRLAEEASIFASLKSNLQLAK